MLIKRFLCLNFSALLNDLMLVNNAGTTPLHLTKNTQQLRHFKMQRLKFFNMSQKVGFFILILKLNIIIKYFLLIYIKLVERNKCCSVYCKGINYWVVLNLGELGGRPTTQIKYHPIFLPTLKFP